MTSQERQEFQQSIIEIQDELHAALKEILNEVGKKLKPQEKKEIENEFAEINELLERLKTGLVWVAVFGKTNAGKSSVINALLGEDAAAVGVEHDKTIVQSNFKKEPWMLVDTPGIMGSEALESLALEEVRKAHAIIFVISEEPFQDELNRFDLIAQSLPKTPKIVFFNQADKFNFMPPKDAQLVKSRVMEKMGKYVDDKEKDIVFGSAAIYHQETQEMKRQSLPELLDRMYGNGGDLGVIMNIIDPASRAHSSIEAVKTKVLETRTKIARKVVSAFGKASMVTAVIPVAGIITMPAVLVSMVYAIAAVMGVNITKESAKKLSKDLINASGAVVMIDMVAIMGLYTISSVVTTLTAGAAFVSLFAALGAAAYIRYNRTVIFGEIAIFYTSHDLSWGGEEPKKVIKRCTEKAKQIYIYIKT